MFLVFSNKRSIEPTWTRNIRTRISIKKRLCCRTTSPIIYTRFCKFLFSSICRSIKQLRFNTIKLTFLINNLSQTINILKRTTFSLNSINGNVTNEFLSISPFCKRPVCIFLYIPFHQLSKNTKISVNKVSLLKII